MRTARQNLYLRWEPETLLYQRAVLRSGGALSAARMCLVDKTILSLKQSAVWPKLDCLYFFAAENSIAALINWKNPGTFNATAVNSPTFTVDRGFAGNGTTSYIHSNYTPSTAGGVYTQNSAHVSARTRSNLAGANNPLIGAAVAVVNARVLLRPRNGANNLQSIINSLVSAIDITVANADSVGHYVINRSGAGATQAHKNGASIASGTAASTALPEQAITYDLDAQLPNFSTHEISSASIGSSLSAADVAAFYAAELAYMQGVGAA